MGAGLLQRVFDVPEGSQMAGFVGLAVSFALVLPDSMGDIVWCISYLEESMCSVQRVREMMTDIGMVDTEGQLICSKLEEVVVHDIEDLPQRTGLQLKNISVSYQRVSSIASTEQIQQRLENLTPSLSGVTVEALPGEHVGVIGRTGAGRSSLNTKNRSIFV